MSITDRLNELLIKNGISKRNIKRELANTCGLSYEAIRQWYTGDSKNIRNDNLTAIAKKFNTTTDWILTGKDYKSASIEVIQKSNKDDHNTISIPLVEDKNNHHYNMIIGIDMDLEAIKKLIPCKDYSKLSGVSMPDDSMSKTINSGDPLLIDENYNSIEMDGVYKVEHGNKTYIRRFQTSPNGDLLMIADNENYKDFTIDKKELKVIGKIVYIWTGKRI